LDINCTRTYFVKVIFYISVINFALIYLSKVILIKNEKIKNKTVMYCSKIKSALFVRLPRARK